MRDLARVFIEALRSVGAVTEGALATDPADLAARLAEALAAGRAAWPALAVDEGAFVAHLARSVRPRAVGVTAAVAQMHAGDLYLARACLDAVPGAAAAFERRYRPVLARYLSRIDAAAAAELAPEIAQRLFAGLLAGTPQRPPGLEGYQGRSTLAHWVGIAAQRLALNQRQADGARRRLTDRLIDEPRPSAAGPEESLIKHRYRGRIEAALRAAVASLSGRDRVVMRLHLVGGVSASRIARMYGVNQTTVSRWLAQARQAIWGEVERRLRAELGLLPVDLESLLLSVASQLDVSLESALASVGG